MLNILRSRHSKHLLYKLRVAIVVILIAYIFGLNHFSTQGAQTSGCKTKHWELPVNNFDNPQILGRFDRGISKYAAGHRGIDLQATIGQSIIAPETGTILWKGVVAGRPTVTFDIQGYKNTFQPVQTSRNVGEQVVKNDELATLVTNIDGSFHCNESCLHWGIIVDEIYFNPLSFVYSKRIVLKVS